jgi:hypothetical protein
MKTYVMTTGALFALITIAHLLRIIAEWPHLATDPFYIPLTLLAAGLGLWAWRLLRITSRRET